MKLEEIRNLSASDLRLLSKRVAEVNRARALAVDYAANTPTADVVAIDVDCVGDERWFSHKRDHKPWHLHGTAVRVLCGPEVAHADALGHLRAIVEFLETDDPFADAGMLF